MEVTKNECNGVEEIQQLIQEFLNSGEGTPKVREYLSTVVQNDKLLLIYLKGRKNRVEHAWETIKRNAEVRFNEYPEVFPETLPKPCYEQQQRGFCGMLKRRDQFGRRVICMNIDEWNPDEVSIEQITSAMTIFADRLLLDEDGMTNGVIGIQNFKGVGWKHVRELTVHSLLRILKIFWSSYPLKVGAVYLINCPNSLRPIYNMMKPFLTKKLKERLVISMKKDKFDILHQKLPPEILPKFLGGVLENRESLEMDFLERRPE